MAPHLEGLSVAASEKLGRRLAYNRVEFDPGLLATANVSDYFNADGYAYDDHSVDDLSGEALYIEGEYAEAAYVVRASLLSSDAFATLCPVLTKRMRYKKIIFSCETSPVLCE
eukprot:2963567-Rhodomonas_salina.3